MWRLNCGCNPPQEEDEYLPLIEKPASTMPLLPKNDPKICELKTKVITDFNNLLDKLECGIQEDVENILEEISLIEIYEG